MRTFLHYVHCKDALLDCSAPGGERCESLTWVDEINTNKHKCMHVCYSSSFDSKIACLCPSIKMNNKHVYMYVDVQMPNDSEVKWAECSLIIGTGYRVQGTSAVRSSKYYAAPFTARRKRSNIWKQLCPHIARIPVNRSSLIMIRDLHW